MLQFYLYLSSNDISLSFEYTKNVSWIGKVSNSAPYYGNMYIEQNRIEQNRIEEYNNKRIIVAFNSNQIKLADGSNTTFDSKNPDIRK